MNKEIKTSIIMYIDNLLSLKGWKNIGEPIIFNSNYEIQSKNFVDYFYNIELYKQYLNDPIYKLLFETLHSFDLAVEDDWLPDFIEGLPTKKSYLFLKEIKNILEEGIADENIEEELIKRYHSVKEIFGEL